MSKILFASAILCILIFTIVSTAASASASPFTPKLLKKTSRPQQQKKGMKRFVGDIPAPPTPSNNHGNSAAQFPSVSLLNQLQTAIQQQDESTFLSLLSDDFQGFFPILWPKDVWVDKKTAGDVINYFFSVWQDIRIQEWIQTASNKTVSGLWDMNAEVYPSAINSGTVESVLFLDDFRKFVLETTSDGQLIQRLAFYQAPAEGLQANATKIAATTRLFYSQFSELDVAKMMAYFTPDATYVEYGFSDRSGQICDYACIQNDFQTAFSTIFKNDLEVRSDADPGFVVFSKISTFRKQFFAIADPTNSSNCVETGMNLASDVIEFDDNLKIKSWTAFYDAGLQ